MSLPSFYCLAARLRIFSRLSRAQRYARQRRLGGYGPGGSVKCRGMLVGTVSLCFNVLLACRRRRYSLSTLRSRLAVHCARKYSPEHFRWKLAKPPHEWRLTQFSLGLNFSSAHNADSSAQCPRRLSLGLQFVEPSLRHFEVICIETFGEPAVDFRKDDPPSSRRPCLASSPASLVVAPSSSDFAL